MYANRRTPAAAVPYLPPGAQHPAIPSGEYTFEVTPPAYDGAPMQNPWDTAGTSPPLPPRPRVQSFNDSSGSMRQEQSRSSFSGQQSPAFPEPMIYGQQDLARRHQYSRSDDGSQGSRHKPHNPSVVSFASSYRAQTDDFHSGESTPVQDYDGELKKLADLSLTSEEGLRRFQAAELSENDREWHRLVPPEAQEALGKQEVQRQSVIFEVIKSELEYVADLEAVQDVFIQGLRTSDPPIMRGSRLSAFVNEVFGNLKEIASQHKRLLNALFERQREQHPLIQSIADVLLDATIKSDFRSTYEVYIKHYPLAESHHRQQLKSNRAYEVFVHSVAEDPRIRKRDLITFLSRPVTRLPRLILLVQQILKLTDTEYQHPDLETLPIILTVLNDCVKSTQPGIEAAEGKVKFWNLCESLVFQKGEIIDMDLYNESRSLVYTGPVSRRVRTETSFSEKWLDLAAALLDNYFILTLEEKKPNGTIKRLLMSRPMPLSFLRLGSFNSPPESRREKTDSFRSHHVQIFPFTVYHAGNRATRRYTLYVNSEAQRKKWYNAFVDAIGVHKARQEANMWFNPRTLTDAFFRTPSSDASLHSGVTLTGRIRCAVPFSYGSPKKRYLAVGCGPGIYIGLANSDKYLRILTYKNTLGLAALTSLDDKTFNRLVVHVDSSLISYSLDTVVRRVGGSQMDSHTLEAAVERVVGADVYVTFFKHVHVDKRAMLVVSSKRRMGTSLNLQVLEPVDSADVTLTPKRVNGKETTVFRLYGQPGYIPKDAHAIASLSKTIGICTSTGIITLDPKSIADSSVTIVPEFRDISSNRPMAYLKERLEGLKPLGFVRANPNELLVIYDEIGFYIDKRGVPVRHSGYIKWEVKAVSYAARNGHILLISPDFIEVRNITTGALAQVISGQDIRLLYAGPYEDVDNPVLVVMRGTKDDREGVSERVVELVETQELGIGAGTNGEANAWDEWDM